MCLEVACEGLFQLTALLVLPVPINQAYQRPRITKAGYECFYDALETLGTDTAQATARPDPTFYQDTVHDRQNPGDLMLELAIFTGVNP